MLGVPNQGTTKASFSDLFWFKDKGDKPLGTAYAIALKRFSVLGFQLLPEGAQMYRDSEFIEKLNEYDSSADGVKYTTVAGMRWGGTDGILEASSVFLEGAKNIKLSEDHVSLLVPKVNGTLWRAVTLDVLLAEP